MFVARPGCNFLMQALACLADQVGNLRQPISSDAITAHNLVYDLPGAQTFHAGLGAILGEVATYPSFLPSNPATARSVADLLAKR